MVEIQPIRVEIERAGWVIRCKGDFAGTITVETVRFAGQQRYLGRLQAV